MLDLQVMVAPGTIRFIEGEEEYEVGQLIYFPQGKLKIHPDNMRRYYDPADVAEMAQSIKAANGVYQSMLVVPDPSEPGKYLVVEGNMRLAGARVLDRDCPRLKCEVITADHAKQLLIMAVTTHNHYPKDPISEALHFERLLKEGYSIRQIADAVANCHTRTVETRLALLKLDEPIRDMVAKGELPADSRAATAILSVPVAEARVKLARTLADRKATVKQIEAAAGSLAKQLGATPKAKTGTTPKQSLTEIKMFSALVAQMFAYFKVDAALLEEAAMGLSEDQFELAMRLTDRAALLRARIAAVPRNNGKPVKSHQAGKAAKKPVKRQTIKQNGNGGGWDDD